MPELPEVETVRRQLERVWKGRTIVKVECGAPSYFFVTSPRTLTRTLLGLKLLWLERVGKTLLAHFQDESRLLLHLGMTGQFLAKSLPPDPHVHMVLRLSGGKVLTFRDVRKFGKVERLAPGKSSPRLVKLGPDALSISEAELKGALQKKRVAIKSALLDQSVLAGVGNIYADEALFRAKIRPTRPARSLKQTEVVALAQIIRSLLKQAVDSGGSTINDYMTPDGELGGFQNFHQVYGKTGEPCPVCHRVLLRRVIGGRSSHYCAACQR